MFAVGLGIASLLVAAQPSTLPWVHDDWPAAAREAAASGKLVAVDVWATWCHTCLSMKNFTLEEPPLARVAGQHVWLSLDYDRPENQAFFATFPVSAFPTFLVVDAVEKKVVARWVGSGSAKQMEAFFASARRDASDPLSLGLRALAERRLDDAIPALERALETPADRTRAYGGLLEALAQRDIVRCAEVGARAVAATDDTSVGLDAVMMASDCASNLPPERADEARALRQAALRRFTKVEKSAAWRALAVDDRSGVYAAWADLLDTLDQKAEGDRITARRLDMLDAAARAAKTPEARATFDPHRVECALRLKRYAFAEKMLADTARAMPKDFNPPARLALILRTKGDLAGALASIDHALALGYGPRKVRLYSIKVDVLIDLGRLDDARTTIADARAFIAGLDPALVRAGWVKALDAQAARLEKRGS
jgi:thiol-disulfide isomerase/thioredoxin